MSDEPAMKVKDRSLAKSGIVLLGTAVSALGLAVFLQRCPPKVENACGVECNKNQKLACVDKEKPRPAPVAPAPVTPTAPVAPVTPTAPVAPAKIAPQATPAPTVRRRPGRRRPRTTRPERTERRTRSGASKCEGELNQPASLDRYRSLMKSALEKLLGQPLGGSTKINGMKLRFDVVVCKDMRMNIRLLSAKKANLDGNWESVKLPNAVQNAITRKVESYFRSGLGRSADNYHFTTTIKMPN